MVAAGLNPAAGKAFRNAEVEFLRAHEAYRAQRLSEALNEALKAFESTMKIVCTPGEE